MLADEHGYWERPSDEPREPYALPSGAKLVQALARLTGRELDVLVLMSECLSDKRIQMALGIS